MLPWARTALMKEIFTVYYMILSPIIMDIAKRFRDLPTPCFPYNRVIDDGRKGKYRYTCIL